MAIQPLPIGPAFIQATIRVSARDCYLIAAGYEWRDATTGTAAGWVRPIGEANLKETVMADMERSGMVVQTHAGGHNCGFRLALGEP
jgi:hypothetical protein